MTPAHGISRALVARSLHEAIDAVAAPHVRDGVLSRALAEAGLVSVPERGPVVLTFAHGPLKHALTQRLGEAICDEVLAQVGPLLAHASRMEPASAAAPRPVRAVADLASQSAAPRRAHVTGPPGLAVAPTPPAPAELDSDAGRKRTRRAPPSEEMLARSASDEADALGQDEDGSASGVFVNGMTMPASEWLPPLFVASSDADVLRRMGRSMAGRAVVRALSGLLELVDALEDHESEAPIVLLDCRNPVLQVASLVALAPDLPPGTVVLVWGASLNDELSLRDAPRTTAMWSRLPARVSIEQVANRCIDLLS